MKLIFLGSSFSIVWYMRHHKIVRRTYDKDQDTFRHLFLMVPCLLLALLINEKFTFKEVKLKLLSLAVVWLYSNFAFWACFSVLILWCNVSGRVDIFRVLRSCGHTSSVSTVAENSKHRQLDWTICLPSWVRSFFLHHEYWKDWHYNFLLMFCVVGGTHKMMCALEIGQTLQGCVIQICKFWGHKLEMQLLSSLILWVANKQRY